MERRDGRYLNPITQDYLRQQAIRLRQQGKRFVDIAEYLGVHRNTVSEWWWQYQHYGEAALNQQKRGAREGEGRTLNSQTEEHIQQLIQEHSPDQLGIDSALWTRRAVQELIEQHSSAG